MPALNFKDRFAAAIAAGTKRQTIRAPRADGRPHAVKGQRLFLYVGQRTKACRKLGEATCTRTAQVFITEDCTIHVDGRRLAFAAALTFARADGFQDDDELVAWFEREHGLPFEGSLIEWDAPEPPPAKT